MVTHSRLRCITITIISQPNSQLRDIDELTRSLYGITVLSLNLCMVSLLFDNRELKRNPSQFVFCCSTSICGQLRNNYGPGQDIPHKIGYSMQSSFTCYIICAYRALNNPKSSFGSTLYNILALPVPSLRLG